MNQIGQTLQQARIARGMSIHDVASETRVTRASLEAIEAGDREALPAPVFTRGFVRSFAIAVGVEPEALLEQLAQTAEPIVEPASQSAPRPMPEMATAEHSSDHFALLLSDGYSDSTRMRFGPAALVLVAVVMFLAAWLMVGTSPERGPQTAQPETPVMHQNQTGGVSTTIGLDKR